MMYRVSAERQLCAAVIGVHCTAARGWAVDRCSGRGGPSYPRSSFLKYSGIFLSGRFIIFSLMV